MAVDERKTLRLHKEAFQPGPLIDQLTRQIALKTGDQVESLSYRETEILRMLVEHANDVLRRQPVLIALWGDDNFFNARSMDVFITKLRKKLKADPDVRIVNIRGIGYKLIC